MREVKKLIYYCRAQVKCKAALLVFEALVRINLCAKNVLTRLGLNKHSFDNVIIQVKEKFRNALIQSGEMVGNLAGQSIGEPCLQMTLNTFHLAGVGGKNMTAGIPKMDETIRVSKDKKKLKFASLDVYLEKEYQTREKAKEVIKQIKPLPLNKFVIEEQCQMLWDPNPLETLVEEDKEFVEDHALLMEEKETSNLSPLVLRFVLDKEKCMSNQKTIDQIFWKMKAMLPKAHSWMRSDVNATQWIIRLRLNTKSGEFRKYEKRKMNKRSIVSVIKNASVGKRGAKEESTNEAKESKEAKERSEIPNEIETTWQIRKMLLSSFVHGILGISSCTLQKQERVEFDPVTLEKIQTDELFIETKGANLKAA